VARPWRWAGSTLTLTGILGGSFNPAHGGHRRISLAVADAMGLDDVWWLVSPGNPLKPAAGMAPYPARLAAARKVARRSIIRVSDIEQKMGTRFTADSLGALVHRYPKRRFVWIMGADNLGQFHRWRDWRRIARLVPIAVVARPGYEGMTVASPATAWLRRFVRPAASIKMWTHWRPPALVLLHFRPDHRSATALRRADPDWYRRISNPYHRRDLLAHTPIS
jgi:nicotinate-nucleotide adenylyltransferase